MADALEQRGQRRCSLVDEGLLVTVEHFIAHGRDHGICLALAAGAQGRPRVRERDSGLASPLCEPSSSLLARAGLGRDGAGVVGVAR